MNVSLVRRRQGPSDFELTSSSWGVLLLALESGIGALVSASWNALEGRGCRSGALPDVNTQACTPTSTSNGPRCYQTWNIKHLKNEN